MDNKCGRCGLKILKSEIGLEHRGFSISHSPDRCVYFLEKRIKELEEQLKEARTRANKISETYALNIKKRICETDIAFHVAQLRAALKDKGGVYEKNNANP